jgi:hypothetical protein
VNQAISETGTFNVIILTDSTRVEGKSRRIHQFSYVVDAARQTANPHVQ